MAKTAVSNFKSEHYNPDALKTELKRQVIQKESLRQSVSPAVLCCLYWSEHACESSMTEHDPACLQAYSIFVKHLRHQDAGAACQKSSLGVSQTTPAAEPFPNRVNQGIRVP